MRTMNGLAPAIAQFRRLSREGGVLAKYVVINGSIFTSATLTAGLCQVDGCHVSDAAFIFGEAHRTLKFDGPELAGLS
jgi:hypothetical protein